MSIHLYGVKIVDTVSKLAGSLEPPAGIVSRSPPVPSAPKSKARKPNPSSHLSSMHAPAVKNIVNEIHMMYTLRGNTNIVSYEDTWCKKAVIVLAGHTHTDGVSYNT